MVEPTKYRLLALLRNNSNNSEHLPTNGAPAECLSADLIVSDMRQNKDSQHSTSSNRKHPRSKEITVLLLSVQLLIVTIAFFGLMYYMFCRNQPVAKVSSTTQATTRYHRLHVTTQLQKIITEDDPTYKALIYTDHPECTDIGRSFLLRGGNAQDAAISALFCLSAAHPQNTGIGGGFFAMMGIPGKCIAIDARETAGGHLNLEYFLNHTDRMAVGITSVATPSFLPGIHTLYTTTSGKFSLQDLAKPTIDLCNSGIPVDDSLAAALQNHRDMILNDYIAKKVFVNPDTSDVYKTGDRMYCSKYSQTLSEILELEISHEYFDQRPFAEQIIAEMEEAGGYVTLNDMDDYAVRKTLGYEVKVGDFKLCGPGAPSAFPISAISTKAAHVSQLPMEAIFPVAFRELKRIGDYDVDASNETVPEMLKDSYVRELVRRMEAGERAILESYEVPDHSTVLVADEYGRAITVSASLGDTFGSRFFSRLGFFYNNAISSFNRPSSYLFNGTMDPGKAFENHNKPVVDMINVLQPGKAPRTLISPVIGYHEREIVFLTSGADIKRQAETLVCLLAEEECKPDHYMAPAVRQTEDGYEPLFSEPMKMGGY